MGHGVPLSRETEGWQEVEREEASIGVAVGGEGWSRKAHGISLNSFSLLLVGEAEKGEGR